METSDEARRRKAREYHYAYLEANPDQKDKSDARIRAWKKAHPAHVLHGVSFEKYERMLSAQGGVCAICHRPETKLSRPGTVQRLAVDHDHRCCPGPLSCGKCVRGLLCARCNWSLGRLGDDVVQLAADYVREHATR